MAKFNFSNMALFTNGVQKKNNRLNSFDIIMVDCDACDHCDGSCDA